MSSRNTLRRHCFIVIVAILALYQSALGFDLVNWDDDTYLLDSTALHSFDAETLQAIWNPMVPRHRFGHEYLPLKDSLFALDWALASGHPAMFHLTNILLYLACGVAVLFVLRELLEDDQAALIGALLFCWHPLHVESVAWAHGRKELLSGLLTLLAWKSARRDGLWGVPCATLLFVAALLAKSTVVFLPLALLIPTPRDALSLKDRLKKSAPLFLVSAVFVPFVVLLGRRSGVIVNTMERSTLGALWAGFCLPGWYLLKLFAPWPLQATYPNHQDRVVTDAWHLLGASGTIVLLVTVYLLRRHRSWPTARWCLGWALLSLAPTLNFFPRGQLFSERYAFLAVLSLSVGLGACSRRLIARRGGWLALASILGLCLCGSAVRLGAWRNGVELWSSEPAWRARSPQVKLKLAEALTMAGDLDEAEASLKGLLASDPRHARALLRLAKLEGRRGNHGRAADALRRIDTSRIRAAHGPTFEGSVYNALAVAVGSQGGARNLRVAAELFGRAFECDPFLYAALYNRARCFQSISGKKDEAITSWRAYLEATRTAAGEGEGRREALQALAIFERAQR